MGRESQIGENIPFHNRFVAEVTQHVVMWPHQDEGGLRNIVQCYAEKKI